MGTTSALLLLATTTSALLLLATTTPRMCTKTSTTPPRMCTKTSTTPPRMCTKTSTTPPRMCTLTRARYMATLTYPHILEQKIVKSASLCKITIGHCGGMIYLSTLHSNSNANQKNEINFI